MKLSKYIHDECYRMNTQPGLVEYYPDGLDEASMEEIENFDFHTKPNILALNNLKFKMNVDGFVTRDRIFVFDHNNKTVGIKLVF